MARQSIIISLDVGSRKYNQTRQEKTIEIDARTKEEAYQKLLEGWDVFLELPDGRHVIKFIGYR